MSEIGIFQQLRQERVILKEEALSDVNKRPQSRFRRIFVVFRQIKEWKDWPA
jgi:hypothetical protein